MLSYEQQMIPKAFYIEVIEQVTEASFSTCAMDVARRQISSTNGSETADLNRALFEKLSNAMY